MVTKEKVEEMCWYVLSLIEQYKEKTDKFKETPQLDGAEYIWCKGWRAPHEPIFFEEATCGNISEPRHPIARTPRKKVHVSIHYYRDKMPIYSQIYGAEGDVICETFYTHDSGKTYGLTYDRKGELNMLSIESQNEKGLPVEYIVYRKEIWNFGNPLKNRINYATYEYDENDKIKGGSFIYEMIVNLQASNDPEELLYSISNPPHDYYLSYDDETVVSYTRTDYSSSLELLSGVGGPWKFQGYLLKRYHEYGIEYI